MANLLTIFAATGIVCGNASNYPEDMLVNSPDYVVYVPRRAQKPKTAKLTPWELRQRGDTYNDHFQVVYDETRALLYAFWTQASWEDCPDQHIVFSKSANKGASWSDPVVLAGSE